MNIKEYIESGILEAYILGALTPEDQVLVEANIAQFPELADELLAIEKAMHEFSAKLTKEPPTGLEDKIWGAIQSANGHTGNGIGNTQDVPKIIPFQPEYAKPKMQWKYAAVWVGLIGSLAGNAMLWNKTKEEAEAKSSFSAKIDKLQADQQQMTALLADYQKNKTMMADTGMQTVVLHTMQKGHPMAATLYWSKSTNEAYVSVDGLPQAPKGMQYQLWVMQGGKPVDMGIISNAMPNTPGMQKVSKPVTGGEAFAISLEKEGGSPTPTMENIYVMGKPS